MRQGREGREQHGSHRSLLRAIHPSPTRSSDVDAIIVPISHPVDHLAPALRLARELNCPLVALCSQDAKTAQASALAEQIGTELVAIDFTAIPDTLLPDFATTELLAGTTFEYGRDTSAKRNLGLLLSGLLGWERIAFLDDDITVSGKELRHAAYLLNQYDAVGLAVDQFPDNSVVCHARRATDDDQETFIGGGALIVGTAVMTSFFPQIYNEDWFFLLDGEKLCPAAMNGFAKQEVYDPFDGVKRAESEEFGDCLAEGVFWLLDGDEPIHAASEPEYWHNFLEIRLSFIEDVMGKVVVSTKPAVQKQRMIEALSAARVRSMLITPTTCADYVKAWQDDRKLWREHVEVLQQRHAPDLARLAHSAKLAAALSTLGIGA